MLASLLPGLRDVRTPLVVGYLWLTYLWVAVGENLPTTRPSGQGLVARLFDLAAVLPGSAPLAAVSFLAYVLGAMLTIPLEGYLGRRISPPNLGGPLVRMIPAAREAWETNYRYRDYLTEAAELAKVPFHDAGPLGVTDVELRTRLLVANQELYGEYDRLAAEAGFRLNLIPPLVLLVTTIPADTRLWGWPLAFVVVVALATQGLSRHIQAWSVLRRAVLEGAITDPIIARWQRINSP